MSPGDVAGGCKLLRNRYESKDREWASYTCVLGFHVVGKAAVRAEPSGGGARPLSFSLKTIVMELFSVQLSQCSIQHCGGFYYCFLSKG